MKRALCVGLLVVLMCGCTVPPERDPLALLPAGTETRSYTDLLDRARRQAKEANGGLYVNRWSVVEDAAAALEQTATLLVSATDVPKKQKDTLAVRTSALGKEAATLREAARSKELEKANEILRRITLQIRELNVDE
jgi:hypothetical protein